jgi:hypothetical protein
MQWAYYQADNYLMPLPTHPVIYHCRPRFNKGKGFTSRWVVAVSCSAVTAFFISVSRCQ